MLRRGVVERDFFTGFDLAQGKEKHVPVHDPAEAIRRAGMIDECCRIAAAAGIDAPIVIQLADADLAAFRNPTRGFAVANFFAKELADFSARRQSGGGKTSFAIDAGFFRD